jgi:hypothetical protein
MENTMDMDDLTPAGSGSLRFPVPGPSGRTVATFTPTRSVHPDEIWQPFTRLASMTTDGTQGNPFGSYRPGRFIVHEPVDRAERMAMHTAQSITGNSGDGDDGGGQTGLQFNHAETASAIRGALRPGGF